MRYFKLAFNFLFLALFIVLITYLVLPKGYIFLKILEKKGIKIAVNKVKENFWGAEFFDVNLWIKGYEFKVKKIKLNGKSLFIPCGEKSYIKISYLPLKKVKVIVKDFSGACIGRSEVKKISGEITYIYPEGLYGNLYLYEINYFAKVSKALITFKKDYLYFQVPELNIRKKFKL